MVGSVSVFVPKASRAPSKRNSFSALFMGSSQSSLKNDLQTNRSIEREPISLLRVSQKTAFHRRSDYFAVDKPIRVPTLVGELVSEN